MPSRKRYEFIPYQKRKIQGKDAKKNNSEVRSATEMLLNDIITKCGAELDQLFSIGNMREFDLENEIHQRGVNIRYLGKFIYSFHPKGHLYFCVNSPDARGVIMTHVASRAACKTLQSQMRKIVLGTNLFYVVIHSHDLDSDPLLLVDDAPFQATILNYLNLLFGKSQASKTFW